MNATSTSLPASEEGRIRAVLPVRGTALGLVHISEHGALVALTLLALNFAFESDVPALGLTSVKLVFLLAMGLWWLNCLAAYRLPRVPRRLGVPVVVWLVLLVASSLAAPSDRHHAIYFFIHVGSGVLIGWMTYDLARSPARRQHLAHALALCGAAIALLGLAEAANIAPIVAWLANRRPEFVDVVPRISSTLTNPNDAAMALELTLPLVLAWAVAARHRWARALLCACMLGGLIALVLTFSRAGALSFLAALGLAAGLAARRRQSAMCAASLASGAVLLALVGLTYLMNPAVAPRLVSELDHRWYAAAYRTPASLAARPGEQLTIPIRLTNRGPQRWSTPGLALGYHLSRPNGAMVTFDGVHTPLSADVAPGATVTVQAGLIAPLEPGRYLVEWDGVQEHVTWFSLRGTAAARTSLMVAGAPVAQADWYEPRPAADALDSLPLPGRLVLWRAALQLFRRWPLLGVGPGNFGSLYGPFAGLTSWQPVHAHNIYLEWLADTGALGLLAFVWFSWRLARAAALPVWPIGRRRGRLGEQPDRAAVWQLALVASLATWFVHGLLDCFYSSGPLTVAFWLVAGLAVSAADSRERRRPPSPALPSARSPGPQSPPTSGAATAPCADPARVRRGWMPVALGATLLCNVGPLLAPGPDPEQQLRVAVAATLRSNVRAGPPVVYPSPAYHTPYLRDSFWAAQALGDRRLAVYALGAFAAAERADGEPPTMFVDAYRYPRYHDDESAALLLIWAWRNRALYGAAPPRAALQRALGYLLRRERGGYLVAPPGFAGSWWDAYRLPAAAAVSYDQGLYAVALRAAARLGLPLPPRAITQAERGYAALYDPGLGYLPVNSRLPASDASALTGEFLSLWLFGRPILPDRAVLGTLRHLTPFGAGFRVAALPGSGPLAGAGLPASSAFGLPGDYQNGASWLLYDALSIAAAGLHGLPDALPRLRARLALEFRQGPVLHEYLRTSPALLYYGSEPPYRDSFSWDTFALVIDRVLRAYPPLDHHTGRS